tara:strand:+ start:7788 stop:9053 length:1266 start_codon:yes stop_codon:yes gene_type:complete
MRVVKESAFAAWLIVAVSAAFYSYDVLLRVAPSVMKQELMLHYDISSAALGGITSVYFLSYAAMQMPVGFLMDRYGPKFLLTISGVCCAVGIGIFSMTKIVTVAALSRLLVGFGSSFAFVGVLKLASIMLPPSRFAFVSGATMALGMLGATLGDHVISNLLVLEGWQNVCFQAAILGLILTLLMLFLIPRDVHKREDGNDTASFQEIWKGTLQLMKNPQVWLVAVLGSLSYTPLTLFAEHFGIEFLQIKYNLSNITASSVNSWMFVGWMIGGPLVCSFSDYLNSRRLPIIFGMLVSLLCCITMLYLDMTVKSLSILMVVFGIANSVQVIVFPIARELGGKTSTATAIAMINMICMFSGLLQGMIGWLLDYSQVVLSKAAVGRDIMLASYQVAYLPLPIFLLIALVVAIIMKETYGMEGSSS